MNEMIINEVNNPEISNNSEVNTENVEDATYTETIDVSDQSTSTETIAKSDASVDIETSNEDASLQTTINRNPKSDTEITEEDFRWYCVKTYNSYEERVKKTIEAEIKRLGLSYCVREVVVPVETVFEVRNGKKKTKLRNFLAGYVLVNAAISEQKKTKKKIIDVVTEISGVVAFVGRRNDPAALQPAEVERIFNRIQERSEVTTIETTYRKGDPVGVLVGPFAGFKGSIVEVVNEKQKVKVEITILGRKTPIELNMDQVQFDKPE